MPVSYLPCVTTLLLLGLPLLRLAKGRKAFATGAMTSSGLLALLLLCVYIPGWVLIVEAKRGDLAAQYRLARWTENHDEQIGALILWPVPPDVLGGFAWLEEAASRNYPPALWLVGVRLKYGEHVPKPPDWHGPAGNVFQQPGWGQILIDRAIALGYRPPGGEKTYYWQVFRQ